MISCNIWLPGVIHRSKPRNNALDVFWGIETIIMPLSRQPQKKSFCPVSHSLAPNFMKIFFIMRLPCRDLENCTCKVEINLISLKVQGYASCTKVHYLIISLNANTCTCRVELILFILDSARVWSSCVASHWTERAKRSEGSGRELPSCVTPDPEGVAPILKKKR